MWAHFCLLKCVGLILGQAEHPTPKDQAKKGIVMEIKAPGPGRNETLEDCIAAARAQILAKKYDTELAAAGVTDVLRLAIAVDGKDVIVEEA